MQQSNPATASRTNARSKSNAQIHIQFQELQINQKPQTPVAPSFKLLAYALILLRKGGHPCVFYGDLYGIRANVENPMTPSCDGLLPILMQARKLYANGEEQDYFDQPNCIGQSHVPYFDGKCIQWISKPPVRSTGSWQS